MFEHRRHVVAVIGQLRRGRVDLDDADDAEEQEHHPDDLVAFENVV